MLTSLKNLFRPPELSSFDSALSRERLIQQARLVFIDDEEPLLISELKAAGFAVEHDVTGDDLHKIDQQLYDVAILDYFGVGRKLGGGQGLSLLKHIRRVSPRTRIVAYTSRSLRSDESDFYRLSHAVLPKDLGLVESLAVVEAEVRRAFEKEHLFAAILAKLEVSDEATRARARTALAKALKAHDESPFREYLRKALAKGSEKAIDVILGRLFGHE